MSGVINVAISFCLAGLWLQASSQHVQDMDAESLALSGIDIRESPGILIANPAALAQQEDFVLGMNYLNRFGLPDLGTTSLAGSIPVARGGFCSALQYFGSSTLNETLLAVAYGRKLFNWLDAGIRFRYYHLSLEVLQHRMSAVTGELGMQARLSDALKLGLVIENPNASSYSQEKESMPRIVRMDLSYREEETFTGGFQLELLNFGEVSLAMGFAYEILDKISFRTGLRIHREWTWTFGLGTQLGKMRLDIGFEQHGVLGTSSALSIYYSWKGK